jgi:hypothetical protein
LDCPGRYYAAAIALLVIVLSLSVSPIPFVDSQSITKDIEIIPPDSEAYGASYPEWTSKWWAWVLSIPQDKNPTNDGTGKNCGEGQSGEVWFLAGTSGGSAVRECTIPYGKAIFFPILNSECSYSEFPEYTTEAELRSCSKSLFDLINNLQLTVNGIRVQNLEKYRVESPLFNVTFPTSNIYGVTPGPSQAVSDGFWIMLKPLPVGRHQISFGGAGVDFTSTTTENFGTDVTYRLNIEP